jgi:hypothetical protein
MAKEDRTELITIRVTPRDRRAFEKAAAKDGMTLSEFVRAAALGYMALSLNPHGLRSLAQGIINVVEDGLKKFERVKGRKIIED